MSDEKVRFTGLCTNVHQSTSQTTVDIVRIDEEGASAPAQPNMSFRGPGITITVLEHGGNKYCDLYDQFEVSITPLKKETSS